ncbi:hypothetical protein C8R43DRAFT_959304 [Mycena crocata]|nr:hypothetical protein C8R43DRAFT_959304 [Mycena crocata]
MQMLKKKLKARARALSPTRPGPGPPVGPGSGFSGAQALESPAQPEAFKPGPARTTLNTTPEHQPQLATDKGQLRTMQVKIGGPTRMPRALLWLNWLLDGGVPAVDRHAVEDVAWNGWYCGLTAELLEADPFQSDPSPQPTRFWVGLEGWGASVMRG